MQTLRVGEQQQQPQASWITRTIRGIAHAFVAFGAKMLLRRGATVRVEGLEHLPTSGPVLIAARHYHHLFDGCVFLSYTGRTPHIMVALDWIKRPWLRRVMESACALLRWPVVLRAERLVYKEKNRDAGERSAYSPREVRKYLLRGMKNATSLLQQGEYVVVFPEAYPTIDPEWNPKKDGTPFLPLRSGVVRLMELAERDGTTRVSLVPAGFSYVEDGKRWHIILRLGPPLFRADYPNEEQMMQTIEQHIQSLSR